MGATAKERRWFWLIGIFPLLLASSGQKLDNPSLFQEGCQPDFESISTSYCLKIGAPTTWQSYIDDCFLSGANVTTSQLPPDDGRALNDLLTRRNISVPLWDDARRHGPFGLFLHKLPDNYMFFKLAYEKLLLHFTSFMDFTATHGDVECLVRTFTSTNFEFTDQDCDKHLHRYLCISERGRRPLKPNYAHEERPPKLHLEERSNDTSTFIILEVYNPESLLGWNENILPVCVMESADININGSVNITRINPEERNLNWSVPGDTSGRELITKIEYFVHPPGEGYISCWAHTYKNQRTVTRVSSNQFLYRTGTFAYLIYANITNNEGYTLLDTFNAKTNKLDKALGNGHFTGFSIKVTPLGFAEKKGLEDENTTSINSLWSVFRVSLTSSTKVNEELDATIDASFREQIATLLEIQRGGFYKKGVTLSSSYCEASVDNRLSWPATKPGEFAVPSVDSGNVTCGNILAKHCDGNFARGATWDSAKVLECVQPSTRERQLHKYSTQAISAGLKTTLASVEAEINDTVPLSAVEVNIIADIFASNTTEKLTQSDVVTLANIVNKVSEGNGSRIAQRTRSSGTILESVDRLLNSVELTDNSSLTVTPRYTTLVADVDPSHDALNESLRGVEITLTDEGGRRFFEKKNVKKLTTGDTLETVLSRGADVAVLLPPKLYMNSTHPVRLVVQVHRDDALFNAALTRGRVDHVISVSLDGRKDLDNLDPPVYLLFDNHGQRDRNASCVFWNDQQTVSNWSDVGCALTHHEASNNTDVCVCTHLTHFAQLIAYDDNSVNIVLDMISAVGCVLSLIGLACIGITGIVFTEWRNNVGHKIQLHLSTAIALLMSLFLVDSLAPDQAENELLCKTKGMLLHYGVLASFCWMLIVAGLQYLRLVVVWSTFSHTPYLVAKVSLFGWGFPLLLCVVLLVTDWSVYGPPRCYLTGDALTYGAYVPVAVFVFINSFIFFIILLRICSTTMKTNQDSRSRAIRRLITSVFLFILFGLVWIFALVKLPEVFCVIASLQGVAFFLFFIVLDRETSQRWRNLLMKKKRVAKNMISGTSQENKNSGGRNHDTQAFSRLISNQTSETSFSRSISS